MILAEQEKIQDVLRENITALCKSMMTYKAALSIRTEVVVVIDLKDTICFSTHDDVTVPLVPQVEVEGVVHCETSKAEQLTQETRSPVLVQNTRASQVKNRVLTRSKSRAVNNESDDPLDTKTSNEEQQSSCQSSVEANLMHQNPNYELEGSNHAERDEQEIVEDTSNTSDCQDLDLDASKVKGTIEEETQAEVFLEEVDFIKTENQDLFELSSDQVHQVVDKDLEGVLFAEETPNIPEYKVDGMYRCPFCPFVNTHGSALRVHLTIHSKDKHNRLKCSQCDKVFSRVHGLKLHVKNVHMTKVKCRKCGEVCATRQDFRSHSCNKIRKKRKEPKKRRNQKTELSCEHCSFTSKDLEELQKHIDESHSGFQCLICKEDFRNESELKLHSKIAHDDTKEIKELEKSKCLVEPGGLYSCDGCSFTCPTSARLKTHIKTLKENERTCDFCDATFLCRPGRKNHMREFHPLELRKKVCEFCDKVFLSFQGLYTHKKVVHGNDIDQKSQTMHFCHVCGKGFPVFMYLTRHLKSHDDSKPYECPKCHQTFKYHRNFKTHKEGCLNTSGYPCHICGKVLKTDYNLRLHCRTIHAEEREYYFCRYCGVRFAHQQSRNKHERISCTFVASQTVKGEPAVVYENHTNQPIQEEEQHLEVERIEEFMQADFHEDIVEEVVETDITMAIPVDNPNEIMLTGKYYVITPEEQAQLV